MDKLAIFNEYEKISDDIIFLGNNAIVRFNTILGNKNKDGERKSFYSEYRYSSNKYIGIKSLNTIRRHFDYYISIETINTEYNKEFIKISINDIYICKTLLNKVASWFISQEFENLYAMDGKNLIIFNNVNNIIINIRDKYLEFEPIVMNINDRDEKGVRMYICSKKIYTEIDINNFMGFLYIINTINMYEVALLQLNYLQRPELGSNQCNFNTVNSYEEMNIKTVVCNTERKIPVKKSFFDKMRELE